MESIPRATTILHFIYPDIFPIIDVRTLESLYHFKLIKHKSKSVVNYWKFYEVIHRKKKETGFSLRMIDRALFSYHKINLNKTNIHDLEDECISIPHFEPTDGINRILEKYVYDYYKKSIDEFTKYLSDKYINDSDQKEIFLRKGVWLKVRLNYIAGLLLTTRNKDIFSPKDIREVVRKDLIPSLSEMNDRSLSGLILTQDVQRATKIEYNNGYTCLEKVSRGNYRFVGFLKKQ